MHEISIVAGCKDFLDMIFEGQAKTKQSLKWRSSEHDSSESRDGCN